MASRSLRTFQAASVAVRALPLPLLAAAAEAVAGRLGPRLMAGKAAQLGRHIERVAPQLDPEEVQAAVRRGVGSYARYWVESFRLPGLSARVVDRGFSVVGYDNVQRSLCAGVGPILVLPHLGGWEWAAAWLGRVMGERVTAVVERLEPTDLFDWFVTLRQSYGIDVVPVGPEAMGRLVRAVKDERIVCLLSDRDITGSGVEVEFFGERTTLPAGPALLARRTGAPLLPTAVYFRRGAHVAHVGPPVEVPPNAPLRQYLTQVTQELATALEGLIVAAPDQWHLLEPNWPSDGADLGPAQQNPRL
ncbi:MAG: phosphatidylinositol mannoside acyltransferase [Acidimicrobiia bacterium]|nr:phosphatidylinositol mannoside acyltransferase [Acidimicrobiia bacterium]